MAQPAPDNWRGAMTKNTGPVANRASSQPRNQERKPTPSKSAANRGGTRSASQPKQRGKGSGSNALKPPPLPTISVYEARITKQREECAGKSNEELEGRLQQLLRSGVFADAAYLIEASEYLSAKYKTADVVRLMLETRQFDRATQLIQEMNLTSNESLVTLLIKELVLASKFNAAVRAAQDMVPNFGKAGSDDSSGEIGRAIWTPQALVQAMARARQFRTALKFAKQFELLDMFPVVPLVAGMFETRSWDDAISCVMEHRLFAEFPLDVLTVRMLEQRQWTLAVKCMNKLAAKQDIANFQEALVREAARVGDFVSSLTYLREFKLHQPESNRALLRYLVDSMISQGEFYKAIKYAIKFELTQGGDDASEDLEAIYGTRALIPRAIECGQYHVATTYIKKLKLREEFSRELVEIERLQQIRLNQFRQYMQLRTTQYEDQSYQRQLHALLGDLYPSEVELVTLDPVEVEVVISQTEEIVPKKQVAPGANANEQVADPASADALRGQRHAEKGGASEYPTPDQEMANLELSDATAHRQSRFKFAQAASISGDSADAAVLPNGAESSAGAGTSLESSRPGFNFTEFASSVQRLPTANHVPAGQGSIPADTQGVSHLERGTVPTQPDPAMRGTPPPMPSRDVHRGGQQFVPPQPGYKSSMQPQAPMPPALSMPYLQGTASPGATNPNMQFRSTFQPPLPPPSMLNNGGGASNSGAGGFDIASLAMQFHHSGGPTAGFKSGGFGNGGVPPPPPMGYPNGPMHSFQPPGGFRGPPQMPYGGFPPPPPPQSTFKPSIGYTTSVVSARPKKLG